MDLHPLEDGCPECPAVDFRLVYQRSTHQPIRADCVSPPGRPTHSFVVLPKPGTDPPRYMRGDQMFIGVEWEIAADVGEGEWQVLGRANGSGPEAALSAWIDEQGGVEGGSYGVRSLGAVAWQPFQVVAGVRAVDEPGSNDLGQ